MLLKRGRKALFVIFTSLVLSQAAFAAGVIPTTFGFAFYPFQPSFDRIVLTTGEERWLLLICGFLILALSTTLRRKISRNRRREIASRVAKIEPIA